MCKEREEKGRHDGREEQGDGWSCREYGEEETSWILILKEKIRVFRLSIPILLLTHQKLRTKIIKDE